MIGGMSWESSSVYYQLVNRAVQQRLGGMHSARVLMHSFDFQEIADLQDAAKWDEATARMCEAGLGLARGGADFLMICCNTMHRMADAVEKAAGVPLLHIADPLGEAIRARGIGTVGLIGSRHTMEQDAILTGRLRKRHGLEILVPEGEDFRAIDRIVYEEMVRGRFEEPARARTRDAIGRLAARGARGIVLGCTEFPILVKPDDSPVPLFDTTTLHAMAAVDLAVC
ncbi:MAG TPA: aspartate/glutamate racemase family protein [Rhizomicrobium sp.]|nr:aspartate/glutamate racemase family protein [Rhizomicrobium sp.]